MKKRCLIPWLTVLAVLAPTPALAGLTVKSNSSNFYWIIRQDIMDNLDAPDLRTRYRMIENQPYGPHPVGDPISPKLGATFWVFPACGPDRRMKAQSGRMIRHTANVILQVECQ